MAGVGAGGYAQAFMGVADLLTGASADAAYEAAYGTYFQSYSGMLNASNAKVAAEANIAALRQDRINTDTVIAMQQDQAEAKAKVSAAVSGTTGDSVNAVIYQTEVNSSVAQANNQENMEQQVENQLAQVYQSQTTLSALDNPQVEDINIGMNLLSDMTQFATSNASSISEGISGLTGSGDTGIMAMNYQLPQAGGPRLS